MGIDPGRQHSGHGFRSDRRDGEFAARRRSIREPGSFQVPAREVARPEIAERPKVLLVVRGAGLRFGAVFGAQLPPLDRETRLARIPGHPHPRIQRAIHSSLRSLQRVHPASAADASGQIPGRHLAPADGAARAPPPPDIGGMAVLSSTQTRANSARIRGFNSRRVWLSRCRRYRADPPSASPCARSSARRRARSNRPSESDPACDRGSGRRKQ